MLTGLSPAPTPGQAPQHQIPQLNISSTKAEHVCVLMCVCELWEQGPLVYQNDGLALTQGSWLGTVIKAGQWVAAWVLGC
jgi:hypothetical protein